MSAVALAAPARVRTVAYPAGVVLGLTAFAVLLGWNAYHYEWLRAYDAWNGSQYVAAVREHGRLPKPDESGVWHTPPLFFSLAALIEAAAEKLSWPNEPQRLVQGVSAVAAWATAVFAFLIARELFPRSRPAQLGALGFAALMPVLVRAGAMYHPEPLATALAAAAMFLAVRWLARDRVEWGAAVVVGVLFALAMLTRTWALGPAIVVVLAFLVRRRSAGVAAAAVVAALTAPWFVHQQLEHGSPVAFSREAPEQSWLDRRDQPYYTTLALPEVFTGAPYEPQFLNRLWPTLYTDWWGDYWRYYEVPEPMTHAPPRLPDEYHRPRLLQSWIGLLPSVLIVGGFAGLAWTAYRRRAGALAVLLASPVVVFVHWLVFQQTYPAPDGDTLKAVYLLNAVVPLAVCGGWALAALLRGGRLVFAAALLLLLGLAYYDVTFLVLPGAAG
jgi:hypothetical protein